MRRRSQFIVGALIVTVLSAVVGWRISKARTFQVLGDLITHVDTDAPGVALTFDDGPSGTYTPQVLDTLRAYNVQATFFVSGDAAARVPGVLAQMVQDGHELGNHAYTHDRMILIRPQTVRRQLSDTDALIRAAGHDGPIHFRPPFGAKLLSLPWVLSEQDRLTVMWDMAVETPERPYAAQIAADTVDRARAGSIILLHPNWSGNDQTRAALPAIIEGLRAKGLEPVPVAALLDQAARYGPKPLP